MLDSYTQQLQRLVNDMDFSLFNPIDLKIYVNMARQQVAERGQCIRYLTPSAGSVQSVTAVTPGSGYTSLPTVLLGSPDLGTGGGNMGTQAVAQPVLVNGQVVSYSLLNGGSGYMFNPAVTVTGGGGTGATAQSQLGYTLQLVPNREIYNFSDVPQQSLGPGIGSILAVRTVSLIWGNVRYTLRVMSFSKFQAIIRNYTIGGYQSTPFWLGQFGQGTAGSLYVFPSPDQIYPSEWDCLCLPVDLVDDTTPEAIPAPWIHAVPFYAAHLACLSKATERPGYAQMANAYYNTKDGGLFLDQLKIARASAQPAQMSNPYGRPIR